MATEHGTATEKAQKAALRQLVLTGDVAGVIALLAALDPEGRAAMRQWLPRAKRLFTIGVRDKDRPADQEVRFRAWGNAPLISTLCGLEVLPPQAAARWCAWEYFDRWTSNNLPPDSPVFSSLAGHTDAWCAAFVETAAGLPLSASHSMAVTVRRLVHERGLPCPTGEAFLEVLTTRGSTLAPWGTPLVDRLRDDELAPIVLVGHLGAVNCGAWEGTVEAVLTFCAEGRIERDAVLNKVFDVLTVKIGRRHARTLAAVLSGLHVAAEEIPSGLPYLLGLLGTADSALVRVLLPLAFALASDPDDLIEVAHAVASRPEKHPRTALLGQVRTLAKSRAMPTDVLFEVLDLLSGTGDADFETRVDQLRRSIAPLGGEGAPSGQLPPADPERDVRTVTSMGLWDLPPAPESVPRVVVSLPYVWGRNPTEEDWWRHALLERRGDEIAEMYVEPAVRSLLEAQASGTWSSDPLRRMVHRASVRNRLNVGRLTRAVERVFLAGGLRGTWLGALDIAEEVLLRHRTPPGLAAYLRMLSGYTDEVPVMWRPGPRVRALARSSSSSKARAEARVLLERCPDPDADAVHEDAVTLRVGTMPLQGLWVDALRPVVDLPEPTLEGLGEWMRGHRAKCVTTFPALLNLLATHGVDDFERAMAAVHPDELEHFTQRLARLLETKRTFAEEVKMRGCSEGATPFDAPSGLTELHEAECALRAGTVPGFLSAASRSDGTLDASVLLNRLRAYADAGAEVGLLDLVLALHRMGPCDPAREIEVPEGLRTDAALTDPVQPGTWWDATVLVRTWFREGGLAEPKAVHRDGEWHFTARPPVPFGSLPSVPDGTGDWFEAFRRKRLGLDLKGHEVPWWPEVTGARDSPRAAWRGVAWHDIVYWDGVELARAAASRLLSTETWILAARRRREAGVLELEHVVPEWADEVGCTPGALPGVWQPMLALAALMCEGGAPPRATDELLRWLSTLLPEVPPKEAVLPPEVVAFAASPGTSAAQREARLLVDVAQRRRGE